MAVILRRPGLGHEYLNTIVAQMQNPTTVVSTRQVQRRGFPQGHDLLIRWGCTARAPIRQCLNTPQAIHQVNDKLGFRRLLQQHGLCPPTWFSTLDDITYPCIVRPSTHSRGRDMHVCNSQEEMNNTAYTTGEHEGDFYIQALINKAAEYRVFIIQGRVIAVAQKIPDDPTQVAWNHHAGSIFENVPWGDWPLRVVRKSVEAFNLSSLDFGGVDVITDQEGNAYILEINSAPSMYSEYREGLLARCFDWVIEQGKSRIPLVPERGGWKKFIHPAISEEARLVA